MTDQRMEQLLGAWLQSSVPDEPDARVSAAAVVGRLEDEAAAQPRRNRLGPVLQAAASLAILVIVGALLLTVGGEPTPDRGRGAIVGAPATPESTPVPGHPGPPVSWQSGSVDLQADAMTLRVGDEVFTGAGSGFRVHAESEDAGWWSITPTWTEAGTDLELLLVFGSDADDWWLGPVMLMRPDVIGPDGRRYGGSVVLQSATPGSNAMYEGARQPLGSGYAGPTAWTGSLQRPTCDGFGSESVEVSLELHGLRITADPPSMFDRLAHRLREVPEGLQRVLGESDAGATVTTLECPPPTTVEHRVGDLALTVEPLGSNVLRVLGDDVHSLDAEMRDVAVAEDGRVFIVHAERVLELGVPGSTADLSAAMPRANRVDIGPDDSLVVRGGERKSDKNDIALVSADGIAELPRYLGSRTSGSIRDLNDPVFTPDGSLWVGLPGGLARFDGEAWTFVSRQQTSPLASAAYQVGFGPTKGLAVTSSGDLWMGLGHTLSEFRNGSWIEHTPLDEFIEGTLEGLDERGFAATVSDLGIGPGDVLWAFIQVRPNALDRSVGALVRRADETWSVYPLAEVMPQAKPHAMNILVDDDGAVLVLLRDRRLGAAADGLGARLMRFDGEQATEFARFPSQLDYRLADVGPDGTVWVIGGPSGRAGDRIHIVPPPAGLAAD